MTMLSNSPAAGYRSSERVLPVVGPNDARSVVTAGAALTVLSIIAFLGGAYAGLDRAMIVVVIAATAVTAALVVHPGIGMLGLGLLCTLDVPMRVYVFAALSLRYNTFNLTLLLICLPFAIYLIRLPSRTTRLLLAFLVLLTAGLIPSDNRYLGVQTILEVLPMLALLACFLRAELTPELLRWMAILNATTSLAFLSLYMLAPPSEELLNPNALAHVPVAALASVALAASRPAVIRNWSAIGLLATGNLVLLFLTNSRGGLILGVLLMGYVVLRSPHVWWRGYIVGTVALLLMFASTRFIREYDTTITKWSWLIDTEMTMSTATSTRSDLALLGWNTFVDQPLGIGTGGFTVAALEAEEVQEVRAAHSAWVKILAENGLPGIVLLAAFVVSFYRSKGQDPSRLGLLTMATISLAFVFVEFQSKSVWLLAAGATALLHRPEREGPARTAPARSATGLRASVLPRPTEPVPDVTWVRDDEEADDIALEDPPVADADGRPVWEDRQE